MVKGVYGDPEERRAIHGCRFGSFRPSRPSSELDIDFNGIDFGHSNLYENLLLTHAADVHVIEDRARKETLRFIASRPLLPPNEEAIAPTYMELAWRAQNTFDEAHALHRATYEIYVSNLPAEEKERSLEKVLQFYKDSRYAITGRRLDHQRLDTLPYSKAFRERFPLFNATIWAYHYLQIAVYDPLAAAPDLPSKQQAVQPILDRYHRYLAAPPTEWTFMPLTSEYSPLFTQVHPEIANIFDNLHMLHDTISDILSSELFRTWEEKRQEIYHAPRFLLLSRRRPHQSDDRARQRPAPSSRNPYPLSDRTSPEICISACCTTSIPKPFSCRHLPSESKRTCRQG